MKNLSRILWGIVLIFIGVIWGLNRTGVADINIFFDGWWTLFIIVPSAISFFEKGNNKISSLIFLIIGVLLLLAAQGLFEFEILWEILLPVIGILIGLFLIFDQYSAIIQNHLYTNVITQFTYNNISLIVITTVIMIYNLYNLLKK